MMLTKRCGAFFVLCLAPLFALYAAGEYARPLYEAENATLSGAVIASANAGYSGTGYADFSNQSGDYIQQQVILPLAGAYRLDCRYANGNTSASSLKLEVNATFVKNMSFAPSGGWSTWSVASADINLNAENNTIKLTSIGSGIPAIDKLEVAYKFLHQSACPSITELPDPFKMYNGSRISSTSDWEKQRHYIKEMLQFYQYGKIPLPPESVTTTLVAGSDKTYTTASGKQAYEKAVTISFYGFSFKTHVYYPKSGRTTYPVVVLISWGFDPASGSINFTTGNLDTILDRGYGVANFVLTDIASETDGNRSLTMYAKFPGYDFGAVAAWAYAASRVVDYLETESWVDKSKIVVSGHSRTGKAALCAGIYDERIAVVNPNGSGCGGAGCYRIRGDQSGTNTGEVYPSGEESIYKITGSFPYWFNAELTTFSAKESYLPYDLHFGRAACAPRPLITTDGLSDSWANPYGTQLTFWAAREVYDYLGIHDKIACHYRAGGHNQMVEDINALLDFCDLQFYSKVPVQDLCNVPLPNASKPYSWTPPQSTSNRFCAKGNGLIFREETYYSLYRLPMDQIVIVRKVSGGAPMIFNLQGRFLTDIIARVNLECAPLGSVVHLVRLIAK